MDERNASQNFINLNIGQLLNLKLKLNKSFVNNKYGISFNKICINEGLLPNYTNIYIYINNHVSWPLPFMCHRWEKILCWGLSSWHGCRCPMMVVRVDGWPLWLRWSSTVCAQWLVAWWWHYCDLTYRTEIPKRGYQDWCSPFTNHRWRTPWLFCCVLLTYPGPANWRHLYTWQYWT